MKRGNRQRSARKPATISAETGNDQRGNHLKPILTRGNVYDNETPRKYTPTPFKVPETGPIFETEQVEKSKINDSVYFVRTTTRKFLKPGAKNKMHFKNKLIFLRQEILKPSEGDIKINEVVYFTFFHGSLLVLPLNCQKIQTIIYLYRVCDHESH